jgi:hypothetical protein
MYDSRFHYFPPVHIQNRVALFKEAAVFKIRINTLFG